MVKKIVKKIITLKRLLLFVIFITFVLLIFTAASCSNVFENSAAKEINNIIKDSHIENTSIAQTAQDITSSSLQEVSLAEALQNKDNYKCIIKTPKGVIAVKFKNGKIREDVMWEGTSITSYIIGDSIYLYVPSYNAWLKYPYSPVKNTSVVAETSSIYSESELSRIDEKDAYCIKSDINENEFEFPIEKAVDMEELKKSVIKRFS